MFTRNPSSRRRFGSRRDAASASETPSAARYHSHGGFVLAWSLATLKAARAGFIRPVDAFSLLVVGARADVL